MTEIEKTVEAAAGEIMPFESWERLKDESGAAYAAFRVYRDLGFERNIRRAVAAAEPDAGKREKRYRVWRNWSAAHRWAERAADYDRYTEKLKAAERRKTIEAQGEKHREVTGKMLALVEKKLDAMNPAELTQGAVTEWVQTAIRAEREAGQFADANCLGVSASRNSTPIQGELVFAPEFKGL